jgi:hypothetical protein
LLEEWRFRVEGLRQGEARLRITGRELASRSPVLRQEGGRGRGLSYSLVGEDHDIRGVDEGGYLFVGFEVELVGALTGDEGDHVVIPDLDGYLGRRFPLYHLGDSTG